MNRRGFLLLVSLIIYLHSFALAEDSHNTNFSEHDTLNKSSEPAKKVVSDDGNQAPLSLSLDQCLKIALEQNRHRSVSVLAVKIAECQHREALSSYWPRLMLNSSYSRLDEDLEFIFPEETSDYTISGFGTATVTVPDKLVKVAERDGGITTLDIVLPVFTGGMSSAIVAQAESGVEKARQVARRTDLKVIYDVKRMYYSAVLAGCLYEICQDVLGRMNGLLILTERFFKEGSGSVTKIDYLRNKIMVESIRSAAAGLESNREISKAALLNTMGLTWRTRFELSGKQIPYKPYETDLERLVCNSYAFNPDWKQFQAGLEAVEAKLREEKGALWPTVALTGTLWRMDNSYDAGMTNKYNENGWEIGFGIQVPIFSGFRTFNRIKGARARLEKMQNEQILLREGIALQIKNIFLQVIRCQKQLDAVGKASRLAEENRNLCIRAYNSELIKIQDVMEVQLMETVLKAVYAKTLYDHCEAQFHMDFVVGSEVNGLSEWE